MSQRSPYNDRYKVEQRGKTRKSASAARPKREVADLTPRDVAKPSAKKRSIWSRAPRSSSPAPTFVVTPRMRMLRRWWWVAWSLSLAIALGILYLQRTLASQPVILAAWAVWFVSMGVAFFLEFVPLRKERLKAIEAAKHGGKGSKGKPSGKNAPDAAEGALGSGGSSGEPPAGDAHGDE